METAKQQRNTPPRDIDAELGRRAHMLIWDAKRTQGSVAAEMGIGSDSLGRKLKGERGWALAEIVDLAATLETTVAYLAGETEDPRPENPNGGRTVGSGSLDLPTSSVKSRHLVLVPALVDDEHAA